MQDIGFAVNDFIFDHFDLPLTESVEYYTEAEFIAEVKSRIESLVNLGYNIQLGEILQYEFLETNKITAGIKSVGANKYIFIISRLAARKQNQKYLDTIIYHELCHILQLDFLFNNNILYYQNGGLKGYADQKERIDNWYYANKGHTELWYTFANNINRKLLVAPPIADKLDDRDLADIFLENFYTPGVDVSDTIIDTFKE